MLKNKNLWLLPTDKPIKNVGDLVKDKYGDTHIFTKNDGKEYGKTTTKLNIYITNDEEIKEGDYVYRDSGIVFKITKELLEYYESIKDKDTHKRYKIILTTDQELIADGVQAIDDKFLEWLVNNPSCEEVEVKKVKGRYRDFGGNVHNYINYKAIIPKEEPIQESYICPHTKIQCDDECCVSAEDCHIKSSIGILSEPKQRLEKYSERFDNNKSQIGNPETWGKRIKQETLEEVAERILANNIDGLRDALKDDDLFFFYKGVIQCYGEAMVKWQQEQIGKSEFLQKLRATLSDAEARRLIFETFKNK